MRQTARGPKERKQWAGDQSATTMVTKEGGEWYMAMVIFELTKVLNEVRNGNVGIGPTSTYEHGLIELNIEGSSKPHKIPFFFTKYKPPVCKNGVRKKLYGRGNSWKLPKG